MKKLIILPILAIGTILILTGCKEKLQVTESDTVTVSYDSFLENGKIIEKDQEKNFVIGLGQTFPSFDQELLGMKKGETKEFTATAENAYGIYYENNKIQEINPTVFSNIGKEPIVGKTIELGTMKGFVLDISSIGVKIDFNEEHTREAATFVVKILEIERN